MLKTCLMGVYLLENPKLHRLFLSGDLKGDEMRGIGNMGNLES